MELEKYRIEIDRIDSEIAALFAKRMAVAGEIGRYKKENGMSITDAGRESEVVKNVRKSAGEYADYATELYTKVFEISKKYQREAEKK